MPSTRRKRMQRQPRGLAGRPHNPERMWLDAMICGKTFVASAEPARIERLMTSLQRDVRVHGRDAMLEIYRHTYRDCVGMQEEHFEELDVHAQLEYAWDVVFLNACRSVLHDVPLTLYESKPAPWELQQPEMVGADGARGRKACLRRLTQRTQ